MNYSGSNIELAEKIQNMLQEGLGRGSAVSFSLVRDGEVICSAAAEAEGSRTPQGIEGIYNVGSISKIFCAAAVMKLCEMGKLDLDTPVSEYLPGFTMRDERYRGITLRMCLNHSSGLPGTIVRDSFADSADHRGFFNETFFSYLSETGLKAEPGKQSAYCNDGFYLAGEVVAAVSGMPFTEFLVKYIAEPLGIFSLRTPENFSGEQRHVVRRGFGEEFLYSYGSGGVAMSVEDCAKFGWSFVEPGQIMSPESAAEMAAPQRLAADPRDAIMNYGLGWDIVEFSCDEADFGSHVLFKSGGTPSFVSYLLISPDMRFSAAISATTDIGRASLPFFIEVLCAALGISKADTTAPEGEKSAFRRIPEEYKNRFSGTYLSSLNVHQVSFDEECLTVMSMAENGWTETVAPAYFDGEQFIGKYYGEPARFSFTTINGTDYLNVTVPYRGTTQKAEKPASLPPAVSAWTGRNGKKYLMENGHSWDISIAGMAAGISLETFAENGLVKAKLPALGSFSVLLSAAYDDDTARMFLTASYSARNQFDIFVTHEGGYEHLHCAGYSFIEIAGVPEFSGEELESATAGGCACFRIKEKTALNYPRKDMRVILLDNDFHITCDSRLFGLPQSAGEGYMILM